jgi:hypothetical protein
MDISEEIIQAKKALNQLQMINANPEMNGKKLLYDTCIMLETIVQRMIIRTANYKDEE